MTDVPITAEPPLDPALAEEAPLEVLTDEEHWDDELKALVCIVESFSKLDAAAILRVMRWARARYLPWHQLVDKR
jgi:hypothetical protein